MLAIQATRDSVGMADDIHAPHQRTFRIAPQGRSGWHRVRAAIAEIQGSGYLPYSQIWVVRSGSLPLAVIAGRWAGPKMVHPEGRLPEDRLAWHDDEMLLHFTLHVGLTEPPGPQLIDAYRGAARQLLVEARRSEGYED